MNRHNTIGFNESLDTKKASTNARYFEIYEDIELLTFTIKID
jgi:hypothetical protein